MYRTISTPPLRRPIRGASGAPRRSERTEREDDQATTDRTNDTLTMSEHENKTVLVPGLAEWKKTPAYTKQNKVAVMPSFLDY